MAIIALTAPAAVAAASHTGRALVSSLLVRGVIVAIILGVAWYLAQRRRR